MENSPAVSKVRTTVVVWIGIALVASACTTRDSTPEVVSSAQATAYLATVSATESDFATAFQEIWNATNKSYATRGVLFEAVSEANFGTAASVALDAAVAERPPEGLDLDHDAWVAFRQKADALARNLPIALEHENMEEMMDVLTGLEQSYGTMVAATSRTFCLAASFDTRLCRAPEDLSGGDYGRRIHEMLRRGTLRGFGLFTFPAALSEEERATRLEQVQPLIEASLAQSRDELEAINPPAEFREDHAALVRFFTEQHLTAVAITEANALRDTPAILALFDESGVNEDRLVHALSASFEDIAAPFFAGDFTN